MDGNERGTEEYVVDDPTEVGKVHSISAWALLRAVITVPGQGSVVGSPCDLEASHRLLCRESSVTL